MTAEQVKTRFLIELDAVASGAAPGFTDSEISELVDKAQKDLILQLAKAKKWDDLYTLITKNVSNLASGAYGTKSRVALLPNNWGYYVFSRVRGLRQDIPDDSEVWYNCDLISPSIVDRFITTSFNIPFFKNPVVFFWDEDGSTEEANIISDIHFSFALVPTNAFEVTYVKIPTTFSITDAHTLELPETLHDTVIAMAVEEAVKSLKTAKISTQ